MLGRSRQNQQQTKSGGVCVRYEFGEVKAAPVITPEVPLTDLWKRALRDSLGDLSDWRCPQIIVPQCRTDAWPHTPEVDIQCDDQAAGATCRRVLAALDGHSEHEFAIGDIDPWRAMEYRHRPESGTRIIHPCVLPRPPSLLNVPLATLAAALPTACRAGWHIGGRYYFVPPRDYRPLDVNEARWRHDRAFPHDHHPVSGRSGFVDDLDQVCHWHAEKRHWDVQLRDGRYINVSHDGREV